VSWDTTSLEASRDDRVDTRVSQITEEAFHQALSRLPPARHANDMAGETFLSDGAVFVRVNHHHYRIEEADRLSHADALRLVARFDGRAEAGR